MQTWTYPAVFDRQGEEIVARFPDVPEAITGAATEDEARTLAADALATAIEHYLDSGLEAPSPRALRRGEVAIALDPPLAARAILLRALAAQGLTKVALAARMNRDEKVIRRIVSGKGASLELTLEALRTVGVRPAFVV